jgi:hypothetical protein
MGPPPEDLPAHGAGPGGLSVEKVY